MGDEPAGPFDAWPTGGGGFEYFYGFIAGMTNHWHPPAVYEGTTLVEPRQPAEGRYHFGEDMTDKAITWVRQQKALMPDKPFFMYYAPGATHAPIMCRRSGSTGTGAGLTKAGTCYARKRWNGKEALGVVPADTQLTARPAGIPAWEEIPAELKPFLVRQTEVYAGFLEHTDHQIGRLVDALAALGALDNTLVYLHHR